MRLIVRKLSPLVQLSLNCVCESFSTTQQINTNLNLIIISFVTLDRKTSHNGQFFEIEIYTSSESWIKKLSIDIWLLVCCDRTIFGWNTTIWKSGIWGCKKNPNIEKITFKVVQMKFLAIHITNQKWSFDIFTVGNLQNIFIEHDLFLISWWFWYKRKIYSCDPYNVFLAIATNIPRDSFLCPMVIFMSIVLHY